MRRLTLVLALVLVLASVLPVSVSALGCAIPQQSQPLIAGQHTVIGLVHFYSQNGQTLIVRYEVTEPGWSIPLSHLYVGAEPAPKLAPGSFPFQHTHDQSELLGCTYTVDISEMDQVYVAAHCEAEYRSDAASVAEIEASLPECVTFQVAYPGAVSYVTTTIANTDLAGDYEGWCIQRGVTIQPGQVYNACVRSSYDYLPSTAGQVNYIINNYPKDDYSPGDVQTAIWVLLGYSPSPNLGYDESNVQEILADAADQAEYVPGCGERLVVVLIPVDQCGDCENPVAQINIISVPVTCGEDQDETAWAFGNQVFDKKWGWYNVFQCPVVPNP